MSNDAKIVIGMDEVGWGCIFGPIVVGVVANVLGFHHEDICDSKAIKNPRKRAELAQLIRENMLWGVTWVHTPAIDMHGPAMCLHAALDASAQKTVNDLVTYGYTGRPVEVIIDGTNMPKIETPKGLEVSVRSEPRADANVFECSAASILAKHARDTWAEEEVQKRPELADYQIGKNKGYGTQPHIAALFKHGLQEGHRHQACRSAMNNAILKGKDYATTATPTTTTVTGNHLDAPPCP